MNGRQGSEYAVISPMIPTSYKHFNKEVDLVNLAGGSGITDFMYLLSLFQISEMDSKYKLISKKLYIILMIFPILNINNAITLPAPAFLMSVMLFCFCALQYAGHLLRQVLLPGVNSVLKVGPITGLTANEENSYQCSPERGSTRGHGRWSATLRSGRRSPITGTEKIQRIQR